MKTRKQTKLYQYQQKCLGGGECQRCHRVVHQLSVDHIIPKHLLESLDVTGTKVYDWEENMELVCMPCNKFKSGRLEFSNQKTLPLLKELVNNLG